MASFIFSIFNTISHWAWWLLHLQTESFKLYLYWTCTENFLSLFLKQYNVTTIYIVYLHCLRSNLEIIKSIQEDLCRLYVNITPLFPKGLRYLSILLPGQYGILGPISDRYKGRFFQEKIVEGKWWKELKLHGGRKWLWLSGICENVKTTNWNLKVAFGTL